VILNDAQNVKVSKSEAEELLAGPLRSWPHFQVLGEKLDAEGVVKAFRVEVGRDSPRPQILIQCGRIYNRLNREALHEYLKEKDIEPGKPGRKAKNGKTEA